MSFDECKKRTLRKMSSNDKSNIGCVDGPIKSLLDAINSHNNYYTTSSCSGRIILLRIPKTGKKRDADFLFRTHKPAMAEEILSVLNSIPEEQLDDIWFRQESAIIHVAARSAKSASRLLRVAKEIGFKRSGIFEIEKRFLMELMSTEKMDLPAAKNGKVFISKDYMAVLVGEANKRLERTWNKIEKLKQAISGL